MVTGTRTQAAKSEPATDRFRVGCAGWTIPRHSAEHFPSGPSHLERYSQVCNCCEINTSFYRPHKEQTWLRWAASVPADFRFSVKAPRAISHETALQCSAGILQAFLAQISFLGEKLGPILFQLPPSLMFQAEPAKNFLTMLRHNYSGEAVLEPRHPSWFSDDADAVLKESRIARVAADPACVPAAAHPGGDVALAYFRLHGSPRRYYSSYTEEFLQGLAGQMAQLSGQGKVWCVFDNTAAGFALQNALQLNAKLNSIR